MLEDNVLDPAYASLQGLLNDLREAMEHDHYWASEAPYNHPEFLHEVFQRHILCFLINHRNEDFMELPTSGKPRGPVKSVPHAELSKTRENLLHGSGTGRGSGNSLKRSASGLGDSERAAKKGSQSKKG
ncbi:hypothetical protein HYPSUDRAFT_48182 [Hypholoma sublateritium FD-334 SS-4]|uniref:Uncharacterized protein n=1 Tax=Hypholoma sublateritium (strain FD-334 SS-4) TaxID=945553 RepID=A0A0D2NG80_HYPSF|nr:hypothetical protein HYPSUDRAFT_48182 [Hypholoma sublateritium FD-334 SS-4]